MKSFKTARGFLKFMKRVALEQDMSDCSDWDKLTYEQQRHFYALLAGIQNDLGELQRLPESENGYLKDIY